MFEIILHVLVFAIAFKDVLCQIECDEDAVCQLDNNINGCCVQQYRLIPGRMAPMTKRSEPGSNFEVYRSFCGAKRSENEMCLNAPCGCGVGLRCEYVPELDPTPHGNNQDRTRRMPMRLRGSPIAYVCVRK